MKKRLQLYANSIKISVCTKPTALLIFIVIILAVTIMMSLSFRWIFSGLEDDIYDDHISLLNNINSDNSYDYTNYKVLGDTVKGFYKSGLLAEDASNHISLTINNHKIITKDNKEIIIKNQKLLFVVRGYGYSKNEIESGSKILKAPPNFMKANSLSEKEEISLFGMKFIIESNQVHISEFYENSFYIPYTIEIEKFNYIQPKIYLSTLTSPCFSLGSLSLRGVQRPMKIAERKILKKLGFKQHFDDAEVSLLYALGIFIPVLIASAVNILFINMYMQKVNRRKYALYKVIGMSPYIIAGLMFAESILLALIGCGIGILIDYIIYLFLPISYLNLQHMAWLNYLAIFVMTMIISIAVISVKIIKQAKAPPIDGKLLN